MQLTGEYRLVEMRLGERVVFAMDDDGNILIHDKEGCAEYARRQDERIPKSWRELSMVQKETT